MKLKVYDLDFNNLEPDLTDLKPWEMNHIQGGRRRRNSRPFNANDFTELRQRVLTAIDQWELDFENTSNSLRDEFGL